MKTVIERDPINGPGILIQVYIEMSWNYLSYLQASIDALFCFAHGI